MARITTGTGSLVLDGLRVPASPSGSTAVTIDYYRENDMFRGDWDTLPVPSYAEEQVVVGSNNELYQRTSTNPSANPDPATTSTGEWQQLGTGLTITAGHETASSNPAGLVVDTDANGNRTLSFRGYTPAPNSGVSITAQGEINVTNAVLTDVHTFASQALRNSENTVTWHRGDVAIVTGGTGQGTYVYTGTNQTAPAATVDASWTMLALPGNVVTTVAGISGPTVGAAPLANAIAPEISLNELGDVTAPSPATTNVLRWNGTAWIPSAETPAFMQIDRSSDLATGEGLTGSYLASTDTTIPANQVVGRATLRDLGDVDIGTYINRGVLEYDSGQDEWNQIAPNDLANLMNVESMRNVDVSNPLTGQILTYDETTTVWSNNTIPNAAVTSVDTTGPLNLNSGVLSTDAEVNVQADWTETTTTDDSFIQNKPFTSVDTSGSLAINSGVLSTTGEPNVQADWDATTGDAFIDNKPFNTVTTSGILNINSGALAADTPAEILGAGSLSDISDVNGDPASAGQILTAEADGSGGFRWAPAAAGMASGLAELDDIGDVETYPTRRAYFARGTVTSSSGAIVVFGSQFNGGVGLDNVYLVENNNFVTVGSETAISQETFDSQGATRRAGPYLLNPSATDPTGATFLVFRAGNPTYGAGEQAAIQAEIDAITSTTTLEAITQRTFNLGPINEGEIIRWNQTNAITGAGEWEYSTVDESNTTYTFADGVGSFGVTPLGGAQQIVNVNVPILAFRASESYSTNDLVVSAGAVWRARQAVAASATVPAEGANWEELGVTYSFSGNQGVLTINPSNTSTDTTIDLDVGVFAWKTDEIYTTNSFVSNGGHIYVRTGANTGTGPNPAPGTTTNDGWTELTTAATVTNVLYNGVATLNGTVAEIVDNVPQHPPVAQDQTAEYALRVTDNAGVETAVWVPFSEAQAQETLVWTDATNGNSTELTGYRQAGIVRTIDNVTLSSGEFVLNLSTFNPTVGGGGQINLNWDDDYDTDSTNLSVSVNNSAGVAQFISRVSALTVSGADNSAITLTSFAPSTATPTPAAGVDWSQNFDLISGQLQDPTADSTTNLSGGQILATYTFQADDGTGTETAFGTTPTQTINWRNATFGASFQSLSARPFYENFASIVLTSTVGNVSTAANSDLSWTQSGQNQFTNLVASEADTLSNTQTLTFNERVYKNNRTQVPSVISTAALTRPATVTGSSYTVTTTDTEQPSIPVFTNPRFELSGGSVGATINAYNTSTTALTILTGDFATGNGMSLQSGVSQSSFGISTRQPGVYWFGQQGNTAPTIGVEILAGSGSFNTPDASSTSAVTVTFSAANLAGSNVPAGWSDVVYTFRSILVTTAQRIQVT